MLWLNRDGVSGTRGPARGDDGHEMELSGEVEQAVGVGKIYTTAKNRVDSSAGYAGDLKVDEAWSLLEDDPGAVLIDVRTEAEWSYVGVPDLSAIGREPVFVQWLFFPSMSENPNFFDELAAQGVSPDKAAIVMCRTVNRSGKAVRAMTAKGYPRSYLLLDGFEGSFDGNKHRGASDGWKAAGLPWDQG